MLLLNKALLFHSHAFVSLANAHAYKCRGYPKYQINYNNYKYKQPGVSIFNPHLFGGKMEDVNINRNKFETVQNKQAYHFVYKCARYSQCPAIDSEKRLLPKR